MRGANDTKRIEERIEINGGITDGTAKKQSFDRSTRQEEVASRAQKAQHHTVPQLRQADHVTPGVSRVRILQGTPGRSDFGRLSLIRPL